MPSDATTDDFSSTFLRLSNKTLDSGISSFSDPFFFPPGVQLLLWYPEDLLPKGNKHVLFTRLVVQCRDEI